ncbi:carbonic anhydrase [Laccaria bicolor S238N-H82]|uniref:Carbonic anhydrase n=1 Tax=Laccaria bicolor (strain S238N-H82 / ATCC MYA-4686) TaxID=486041 RepID=B0DFJ5_LACBS|nr:carbonic anhydrase [Laccaria bicolor S238N-H82]EDR06715.1 carbonic anhydrase [Laccaria bicolor S238N-H82]|eukprot:XP_001882562.1 carbonic anhydrase [Laccaria bicolor S238N-H82]
MAHASDSSFEKLLEANAAWAHGVTEKDPNFFKKSAEEKQKPHTLWIGCSDSRVPESVITAARPGDIFVHRNIANQVHLHDSNVLSVLKYAVDFLHVQHVVVVGHTVCGGADACLNAVKNNYPDNQTINTLPVESPLNIWLTPLTKFTRSLPLSVTPPDKALSLVVHENIKKQVEILAQTDTIRDAWARKDEVQIHGWVYNLATGRLDDLHITQKHQK